MRLTVVTGGARSGKSAWAQARALELGGRAATVIATAVASDAEMAERIRRHRLDRPAEWTTLEAPRHAGAALRASRTDVVVVDCLTLLVSNAVLETATAEAARAAAEEEVRELTTAAAERDGELLVVTNEVGWGVVPATPSGRWFRDALGIANQRLAADADEVVLLVSGRPLRLER